MEFQIATRLLQPLSRLKNKTTVYLTMLICLAKRQMHSRITTIGSIPKLLHINFWPSKMRLKSKRKSKLWKTRRMRIKMIWRKPMISVIQYRTNLTLLRTMFRRWSACSLKPNSTQTLLASNLLSNSFLFSLSSGTDDIAAFGSSFL